MKSFESFDPLPSNRRWNVHLSSQLTTTNPLSSTSFYKIMLNLNISAHKLSLLSSSIHLKYALIWLQSQELTAFTSITKKNAAMHNICLNQINHRCKSLWFISRAIFLAFISIIPFQGRNPILHKIVSCAALQACSAPSFCVLFAFFQVLKLKSWIVVASAPLFLLSPAIFLYFRRVSVW